MVRQNSENKKFDAAVLEGIQIMCKVFWGPDSESCRHMTENNFFDFFETIFNHSEAKAFVIIDSINSIINGFESYLSLFDHLNECYVRLFVNSKEGLCAPLYESCYEFKNAPMMGASAVKMKQRFKSKGLSMETRVHEPPDHLAIELEYLFFLLQEKDGIISREAFLFVTETMLPWISVFNQRLESVTDDCRFYFFASSLLVLFLEQIFAEQNRSGQSHL